jgi:excisionase family DNA binding protein
MKSNPEPGSTPALRTIRQAAAALNVGRSTIYELIRHNQLETVKIGRCTRIPSDAIDEFVSALRVR